MIEKKYDAPSLFKGGHSPEERLSTFSAPDEDSASGSFRAERGIPRKSPMLEQNIFSSSLIACGLSLGERLSTFSAFCQKLNSWKSTIGTGVIVPESVRRKI
jgi:hypothetical protein